MPTSKKQTAFRLDDEDRAIIARLSEITGVASAAAVIRLAIRESLNSREPAKARKKPKR